MTCLRRPAAALVACLAAAAVVTVRPAGASAAQPGAAAQDQPRFRSGLDLVTADVVVVDRDGAPVRGLTADDFAVRVDGAPRSIVSVQFVEFGGASGASGGAPAASSSLYATNEEAGRGRLLVFVVDQGNIRAGGGRSALLRAAALLDRLTPADRVALFTLPGPGPAIPFTNEFGRVRDALQRISGRASRVEGSQYPLGLAEALAIADGDRRALQEAAGRFCGGAPSCESDLQADALLMADQVRERTLSSMRGLAAVFDALRTVDGPKTVVLVSEGLVLGRELGRTAEIAAAAAAARAALYVLRLDASAFDAGDSRSGVALAADARLLAEGLETLAGFARGAVFPVTASGAAVFERLARELSGHYLVAFEAAAADRDGRPHQIRVEVRRPGVVVRARREFRTDTTPAASAPASAEDLLSRALTAPSILTDLPLRLSTYVFADSGDAGRVRLALSAEIGRDRQGAEPVTLAFALTDVQGRVVASGLQQPMLAPARADEPGPLLYQGRIAAPPGDYTLRLAAVDAEGRAGSVDQHVRARLVDADPLQLGDLAVGSRAPGAGFSLPAVPRLAAPAILTYIELYSDHPTALDQAQVRIEIAEDEDTPALVSRDALVGAHPDAGGRVATSQIDATALPPGRYVARARVSVDGRLVGTVSRRFEIAPGSGSSSSAAAPPTGPAPSPATPRAAEGSSVSVDVRGLAEPFRREALLEPARVAFFLDELTRAVPAGIPATLASAVEAARQGHFEQAAQSAGEPALHPVSTFLRGLAAFARGDRQAAAGLFRSTLQAARGAYAPLVYLGACYAEGGRDDEAAGAWQTALVGLEELPLLYGLVADAALRSNDARTARTLVEEARTRWPSDDEFLKREVLALLASGEPAAALAALDRYLARQPADASALALGVRVLYQVAVAGGTVSSIADDLARARGYAEKYARAGGAEGALVRAWLKFLEQRR